MRAVCDGGRMATMTKLLEQVFTRVRLWPKERQDDAAKTLLAMEEQGTELYVLDDEERAALAEGRESVEREGVISAADVRARFKKTGL